MHVTKTAPFAALLLLCPLGCSVDASALFGGEDDAGGGAGGGPPSRGASTSQGGAAPGDGGADPSGGGGAPPSCVGDWSAQPEVVLEVAASLRPGSVSVARAELELTFVAVDTWTGQSAIVRASRQSVSEPFSEPEPVPELTAGCAVDQDAFVDVSEDGLRAYVSCVDKGSIFGPSKCPRGGCAIQVFDRNELAAPFVPRGVIGAAGSHPSLTPDELVVVTNGMQIDVGVAPLVATRPTLSADFGQAEPLAVPSAPGVFTTGATLSPDLLELYAYRGQGLGRATRAAEDDSFGEFEPIDLWPPGLTVGAPDLTPDCRALYVVVLGDAASRIDVLRR
jgi:hypothetical protein